MVLIGVSIITFIVSRVVPSNPAAQWVGPRATAEQIQAATIELGLDKPLLYQFGNYIKGLFTGDWGSSIRTHQPVFEEFWGYVPASIELILFGMLIAIILGIPLGVISAIKKGTWIDTVLKFFSAGGVAMPTFWLAIILQLFFFGKMGLLPLGGRVDTDISLLYPIEEITGFYLLDSAMQGNWQFFISSLQHLILPALTMAAYPLGFTIRMVRSSMLDVLGEDYMRIMEAYSVPTYKRFFKYALKNALNPTITSLGLTFASLLTSTFLIESIFSWPGLGMYASQAILSSDYTVTMAVTFFVTVVYIIISFLIDILLAKNDPRIKLV